MTFPFTILLALPVLFFSGHCLSCSVLPPLQVEIQFLQLNNQFMPDDRHCVLDTVGTFSFGCAADTDIDVSVSINGYVWGKSEHRNMCRSHT